MTRSRRITFVAGLAVVAVFALALAGCSSDNQANGSAPASNGAGQGTVDVATSGLGSDPRRLAGPHPVPVREGHGDPERVHGRVRQRLASAPGDRHANGRWRGETPRSWEPPCARTVTHRSPTPATRSTCSRVTRFRRTNGEGLVAYGASWYAVSPAGDQITGQGSSSGRDRARASGTKTVTRSRGARPATSRPCPATCVHSVHSRSAVHLRAFLLAAMRRAGILAMLIACGSAA